MKNDSRRSSIISELLSSNKSRYSLESLNCQKEFDDEDSNF